MIIHIISLFIGIYIFSVLDAISIEKCVTPEPEHENGWCVPTFQCEIGDINGLSLRLFPLKYEKFIRNSKCDDETIAKFCCTFRHINPAFAEENNLINTTDLIEVSNFDSKPVGSSVNSQIDTLSNMNLPDIANTDTHPNLKLLPNECGEIPEKYNPKRDTRRVSFGIEAGLNEFPFIAHLRYDEENPYHGCGGTLINERYILTAAHCVNSYLFSVRLGEHTLDTEIDCELEDDDSVTDNNKYCNDPHQDIPITNKITHEKYSKFSGADDIALLRLKWPANITANNVKFICLPITPELRAVGFTTAQIIGWGATEKSHLSNVLLKGPVLVNLERQKCIERYLKDHGVNVTDRFICATGTHDVDSCKGDSGGPLFQKVQLKVGELKKYMQFGIVAAGPPIKCGDTNDSGGSLYTNIPKYIGWILDNIKP